MHHRSTCNLFSKHLKQNIIVLNVEIIFVIVLLYLEDIKVLYILSHRFLDHLKWTKNEIYMGFENKKRLEFFLQNN
jgi:hypothetical protein